MIKKEEIDITVIGLGYVGLPLAVEFSKNYNVTGFDLDEIRVSEINNKYDRTNELSKNDLSDLKNLKILGTTIYAESGVMLGRLVKECIKNNLTGLESLVGVPGTLGGALIMNAGAFGGEISNYLESVEIMKMNGEITAYKTSDIRFSYRNSSFKKNEFILMAKFILTNEDPDVIKKKKEIASSGRKTNQPLKYRSAGSVFKNPEKFPAGYLIDQAGLKGTKIGGAEISNHHANFFVNNGNASADDITQLIKLAKKSVFEKFEIKLELEIKTIGIKPESLDAYD